MPELPEVEVVRRGAAAQFADFVVGEVVVHDRRALAKSGAPDLAEREHILCTDLVGATLLEPQRRGKFMWFPVEFGADHPESGAGPRCLVVHLGMTGQVLAAVGGDGLRHERIRLVRAAGSAGEQALSGPDLVFADQRIFGYMQLDDLVAAPDGPGVVPESIQHIARDVLDDHVIWDDVVARVRGRQSQIKRVLLDQRVISGIGNIYVDEALWLSKLHYGRVAASLSASVVRELLGHVESVMRQSLVSGGTSFDASYVQVNGESGYHAVHLEVYGRQGEACRRCGSVIVREPFMNRSSHRCPRCQRAPRGFVVAG